MTEPIRVMIVEDHALVRTGLRTALRAAGFEVVAEAADGITAETLARSECPEVAVVDLGLPGRDGVELVRRLKEFENGPRCVVLTTRDDEASIIAAMRAGAVGYCFKSSAEAGLLDALRAAARGATYLDPTAASVMLRDSKSALAGGPAADSPLTARETEILARIARGAGNATIGDELGISLATVKHTSLKFCASSPHPIARTLRPSACGADLFHNGVPRLTSICCAEAHNDLRRKCLLHF